MVNKLITKLSSKKPNLRVAILGHRGIPNAYGGFETLAENLAEKLVDLGTETTVYCRSHYFEEKPKKYKGAKLIYLKAINNKSLETLMHTFTSVLHLVFKNTADTVLMVNVGNAPLALLARVLGKKVILCVDGLDWERKKWGKFAKMYLKTCSYLAKYAANEIVTDATSVSEFYQTERNVNSTLIPYGTDIENINDTNPGISNLKTKEYFTYVARFEPENNPLKVVKDYVISEVKMPLVMIGDNRYNKKYVNEVKEAANSNVIFLGYVFGKKYKKLLKNSLAYVRAAEVGGASPAVIEAMGKDVCVIANDRDENKEIIGDTGFTYNLNTLELTEIFKEIEKNPEVAIKKGKEAGVRAMLKFNWDKIAYEYLKLIKKVSDYKEKEYTVTEKKSKKILVTGAGGMLGSAIYEHFSKKHDVLATDIDVNEDWLNFLDVRDNKEYEKNVRNFKPDYILHLPAITSLEDCEQNTNEAYATNSLSVKTGAKLAKKYNAKFVYISSAGVFDGKQKTYSDDEEPSPINTYGLTKQMGALYAKYYSKDSLTVRPGWMMGGGPAKDKKFINLIVKQIVAGKSEIFAVNDKFGTPTYTRDLAKNIELLLSKNASGTYNTVCGGETNRFEIAREIIKILGFNKQIKLTPVSSDYFAKDYFAKRPQSENLINKKLIAENMNLMQPWKNALKDYLKRDFAYAFNENKTKELKTNPIFA